MIKNGDTGRLIFHNVFSERILVNVGSTIWAVNSEKRSPMDSVFTRIF